GAALSDPRAAATQAISSATGDRDGWSAREVKESDGFYRVRVERNVSGAAPQKTVLYLRRTDGTLETAGIGEDLTGAELPRLPENLAPAGELAASGAVSIAPATPVYEGGAKGEVTERGIEEAVATVEGYPGVAGFYVIDPRDGSGYGIRPDEEFFSASTIKVAVMAAVYRKMDSGDLEYSDQLTTNEEDWAAGAGWLRWNTPGANTTVEDALWLMMTESDNVATNVLMRAVGGPDYVNSVARDLGAQDTDLFWKLSSERAAVPALDNHTTPRDMATMLAGIYEGKGFKDFSRDEMLDLMSRNNLEYWLEGGVPNGIVTANKGGWLDGIYNDVGIVEYEEKPYVVAIYTMNGPELEEGSPILAEISGAVWLTESGKSKEEFGEDRAEQPTEAHPDSDPSPDEDRSSREDKPRRD
ncbi:MAG: serine hydrolase, partial [Rubrobacter sp.]